MAEVVNEIPVNTQKKYPWVEWLDGQIRKLTRGVDFEVSPNAFQSAANHFARRNGIKVTIAVRGSDVYIQAHLEEEGESHG